MRQIPFFRKVILAILLAIGVAGSIHAQSIDQQVVASNGREVKQGSVQLSFTVGEVAVADPKADTLYLTQGYQQAFLDESTPIQVDHLQFDLAIFPNPFSDILTLRCTGQPPVEPLRMMWTDMNGRTIREQDVQLQAGTDYTLNLQSLPVGTYHLTISTEEHGLATFQMIHIQP